MRPEVRRSCVYPVGNVSALATAIDCEESWIGVATQRDGETRDEGYVMQAVALIVERLGWCVDVTKLPKQLDGGLL